ncbi:hypothetical protein B9G55_22525 [Saccharibacillus sp. O16]|nr:hypothetical protein B9G55_22525 [Saccharibacillus sp. O16]
MSIIQPHHTVTLAPVRSEDLGTLRQIAIAAFAEDLKRYGVMPEGIETSAWHEQGADDGSYLAIFADGQLVGGARVFDLGEGSFRIGSLFVAPARQGQGIGANALSAIEAAYPQARRWSLDTPAGSERNQRFYSHAGYVKVGESHPDPHSDFRLVDYIKLPLLALIRDAELSLPRREHQSASPGPQSADEHTFWLRQAARAVLLDHRGRMALMHVSRDDYHKLPGGGIEAGEDVHAALRRELREEAGAEVKIVRELGMTVEYVTEHLRKQFSYAYEVRLLGELSAAELTAGEQAAGFRLIWVTPQEALSLMEKDRPKSYVGAFIQARDRAIVQAYLTHGDAQ